MSRTPIAFAADDISELAKRLRAELMASLPGADAHVQLLNMPAKANGHATFQHLRASAEAVLSPAAEMPVVGAGEGSSEPDLSARSGRRLFRPAGRRELAGQDQPAGALPLGVCGAAAGRADLTSSRSARDRWLASASATAHLLRREMVDYAWCGGRRTGANTSPRRAEAAGGAACGAWGTRAIAAPCRRKVSQARALRWRTSDARLQRWPG